MLQAHLGESGKTGAPVERVDRQAPGALPLGDIRKHSEAAKSAGFQPSDPENTRRAIRRFVMQAA